MRLILEPRFLFDGAIADTVRQTADAHADAPAHVAVQADAGHADTPAIAATEAIPGTPAHEILVVDPRVTDWQKLAGSVAADVRVVVLDTARDPIDQISAALAGRDGIATLHILGYGAPGQITLGNLNVDAAQVAAHAQQIAGWGDHLAPGAAIEFWGCDVGAGAGGQALLADLHTLTGATVAASTDAVGAGSWTLEASTAPLAVVAPFSADAMASYSFVLDRPVPTLSISGAPTDILLGETFTTTYTLTNTATTNAGFGPIIEIYAPFNSSERVTLQSATSLGQALSVTTVTLALDGGTKAIYGLDPFIVDKTGAAQKITAPSGYVAGDSLYIVQLPYASLTPGEPPASVTVTFSLDAKSQLGAGKVSIAAIGGFRYGDSPTADPAAHPSIRGINAGLGNLDSTATNGLQTATSNAVLVKSSIAVTTASGEGEIATGSSFPGNYTLTLTSAPAVSKTNPITGLVVDIPLPDTVQFTGGALGLAGLGSTGGVASFVAGKSAQGGSVHVDLGSIAAGGTTTITVPFFVPQTSATAAAVVDPVTGAAASLALTPSYTYASGSWTPLVGSLDAKQTISGGGTAGEASFTARAFAVQQSATNLTTAGLAGGFLPGDRIEYTIKFQVSDFFGVQGLVLSEVLGDGLTLRPDIAPVLSFMSQGVNLGNFSFGTVSGTSATVNSQTVATSGTGGSWSYTRDNVTTGQTSISFDVSSVLAASKIAASTLQGGGTGTQGTLTFTAQTLDRYTVANSGGFLRQSDVVTSSASAAAGLLGAKGTATGQTIADSSSVTNAVPKGSTALTIASINGVAVAAGTTTQIAPGDLVTYRVAYTMPTHDSAGLKLAAFLPLPVFTMADPAQTSATVSSFTADAAAASASGSGGFAGTPVPGVGKYTLSSNVAGDSVVSADVSATANSVTFALASFNDTIATAKSIDIYFTVKATDSPFAETLTLAGIAQTQYTAAAGTQFATQASNAPIMVQPALLSISKGVVSIIGADAKLRNTAAGVTFTNPDTSAKASAPTSLFADAGSSSVFATGAVIPTAINTALDGLTLQGAMGGDTVRIVDVVANSSKYAAFNVTLNDTLPTGYTIGDVSNLKVTRGDGTTLVRTDGNAVTAADFFSTGGVQLTVGGSALAPALGAAGTGAAIVYVTYDLKVASNIAPGAALFGKAQSANIVNFSNKVGGIYSANPVASTATFSTIQRWDTQVTDWNSRSGAISLFNTETGTLQQIDINASYNASATIIASNTGVTSSKGSVTLSSALALSATTPGITTALNTTLGAVDNINPADFTQAFVIDGLAKRSNFALGAGASQSFSQSLNPNPTTVSGTITDAATLALFAKTGGGTETIFGNTYSVTALSNTGGNTTATQTTTASADVSLTYTYVNVISGTSRVTPASLSGATSVSVTAASVDKVITKGDNPNVALPNVVVGETVQYSVTVTLPQSIATNGTKGVALTDTLSSAGMLFTSVDKITTSANVKLLDPSNHATTWDASKAVTGLGSSTLTVNLGDIQTVPTDGSQGTVTILYSAKVHDTKGNVEGTAIGNTATVVMDGATLTSNKSVTVREPVMNVSIAGAPSPVQAGDTVTYTVTITNTGTLIPDATVTNTIVLPAGVTLVPGTLVQDLSGKHAGDPVPGTIDGKALTIGGLSRLNPGESMTFTVQSKVNAGIAGGTNLDATTTGTWTSMPGGLGRTYTTAATGGVVTIAPAPVPALGIIGESNNTAGLGTSFAAVTKAAATVGEIVRMRSYIQVPAGTSANTLVDIALPTGLEFINDGTSTVLLASKSGAIASTTIDPAGNTAGLQFAAGTTAIDPTTVATAFLFPNASIDTGTAGHVRYNLGTLSNADNAPTVPNYLIVDFNTRVINTAANANAATLTTGSSLAGIASNTVVVTLVEPVLTLSKSLTAVDPFTGALTFTEVVTNTGTATAYGVVLSDPQAGANVGLLTGVSATGDATGLTITSGNGTAVLTAALTLAAGKSETFTYTIPVLDRTQGVATTTSQVTWRSLSGDTQTLAGSTTGTPGSSTGERTEPGGPSGSNGGVNTYISSQSMGFGAVSGRVWQVLGPDNTSFTAKGDVNTALDSVTVTASWSDGKGGTLTATTTTAKDGSYVFGPGILPNTNVTITMPTPGNAGLPAAETLVFNAKGSIAANPATASTTLAANGATGYDFVYQLPDPQPVLKGWGGSSLTYVGSGTPTTLAGTGASASHGSIDTLGGDYGGTKLTVERYVGSTATPVSTDLFSGTGPLVLGGGGALTYGGAPVGTYTQTGGVLTITFAAGVTSAGVANVLDHLAFSNTDPSLLATGVKVGATLYDNNTTSYGGGSPGFTLGTGGARTSDPVFATLNLLPVATEITFREPNNLPATSASVAVAPGLTLSAGGGIPTQVTIALTTGGQPTEDVLAVPAGALAGGIVASFNAGTGTLTLTAPSATPTLAEWQAAVRAVTYTDGSNTPVTTDRTATISVTVASAPIVATTVTVHVEQVDDSPILAGLGSVALVPSKENILIPPAGVTGTAVTVLTGGGNVTDLDGASISNGGTAGLLGVAIVGADTGKGDWWYTTNNGTTWTRFAGTGLPAIGDGNALHLVANANTRIYFQPNAGFTSAIPTALTFRGWDQFNTQANGTLAALPAGALGGSSNGPNNVNFSYSDTTQSLPLITAASAGSLSGRVWQALGPDNTNFVAPGNVNTPLGGITVTAVWTDPTNPAMTVTRTTTTNPDGTYSFAPGSLPDGPVVVTMPSPGNAGLPVSQIVVFDTSGTIDGVANITIAGAPVNNVNFVYQAPDIAPVITNWGGTPTYVPGTPPVALGSGGTGVADVPIDLLGGDYGGTKLTIQRYTGGVPAPDGTDVFSGTGPLTLSGGVVSLGGTPIGTFTQAGGVVVVTFATGSTSATVASVLNNIGYSNTATSVTPGTITLGSTLNDNNTTQYPGGSQGFNLGTGGPLTSAPVFVTLTLASPTTRPNFPPPAPPPPGANDPYSLLNPLNLGEGGLGTLYAERYDISKARQLYYEVHSADGGSIPSWLSFDPKTENFSGYPPDGKQTLLALIIVIRDNKGNIWSKPVTILVGVDRGGSILYEALSAADFARLSEALRADAGPGPTQTAQAEVLPGRTGFSTQLRDAGRMGRLAQARALLDAFTPRL